MPVKMGVDPEKIKAPKPAPAGWYDLKFTGFRPKKSKAGDSINFNPVMEIINHPTEAGKKVYETLSQKMDRAVNDFSHAFGFPLEADGSIPGDWIPDPNDLNNVEKMQYKGPLLGKTCRAELIVSTYNGNDSNKVKQYACKVTDCAMKFPEIKHSTNLIGKNN